MKSNELKVIENKEENVNAVKTEKSYKSVPIQYINSREVAEMVEKNHKDLMRDIRRYCKQMEEINQRNSTPVDSNQRNLALTDFFLESSYFDAKGETRPCYLVTKKGCEFIAHKLTGTKGTAFTAKYINRFHEMECELANGAKNENLAAEKEILQKLMESQRQFIEQQSEFNKTVMDFIQSYRYEAPKVSVNPFVHNYKPYIFSDEQKKVFNERKKNINHVINDTAKQFGINRNRVLHCMYCAMREQFGIDLNSYLDELETRTGNRYMQIFDVIICFDEIYDLALQMNREAVLKNIFS